ncbi:sulfurtransferase complex subunit TusD [Marinomonas sp. 15G1-11]|uniref:Sulfurtransferase complex subunit TusD n=1 Tax=Marinomonas phaeophyticola TaxID=3004091 RepID=A0ABT4JYS7_9GAMM|nr:sulfurtransferase complex subunit TusD [Marinomonas sp. 15G1-11]MCZ2723227.1 sulfurtransferase complex subunit TusD [Marinomonas sp. 15G1-11]
MQYTLFIQGSPFSSKACHSAYRFAQALLNSTQHSIEGVFFYEDSVLIANALMQPPRDEANISILWQELAKQHSINLYVCIAAALRRGVINESEMVRHELTQHSLAEGFQLEGLGTLVHLINNSHKTITFR